MGPSQEPDNHVPDRTDSSDEIVVEFPSLEGSGTIKVHVEKQPTPPPPSGAVPTTGGDWTDGVKFPRREGGE
jgi:hypothetical protein